METWDKARDKAMDIQAIKEYLKYYDGPEMNIMEVCGSHTAAIAKNGIPGLLSDRIHLISGPGCPVCVTPSSYIDRLIDLALKEHCCIVTFGDLMRVPGSEKSLRMAKGEGARVEMVYSPMDVLEMAAREPETQFVFAAVGFETTTPVYALLMDELTGAADGSVSGVHNVRLLTALKTMPQAIDFLCANDAPIHGFLAPGHVSVVTGSRIYEPLAEKYRLPFGVSGFEGAEILTALYAIVRMRGRGRVINCYPAVVTEEGNTSAQQSVDRYFAPADAVWRGMGSIPASGRVLKQEYAAYDAGSRDLMEDKKKNQACRCDQVLMGKIRPTECPLFGRMCTPVSPQGACMVSTEGSCFSWYAHHRS